MKRDWTETMRDKLAESEITPPGDLWSAISSDLDDAAAKTPRVRRRSWRRWAAAAACITALLMSGLYLMPDHGSVEHTRSVSQGTPLVAVTAPPKAPHPANLPTQVAAKTPSWHKKANIAVATDSDTEPPVVQNDEKVATEVQDIADGRTRPDEKLAAASVESTHPQTDDNTGLYDEQCQSLRKKLSISLFASNMNAPRGIGSGADMAVVPPFNTQDPPANWGGGVGSGDNDSCTMDPESEDTDNAQRMPQTALGSTDTYELLEAKHKQPVRFGVSARIPLGRTLSIGTGLTYSLLSSDLTWVDSNKNTYDTHQTLHYLGIPVSIDYSLPSYRSFGFYLTAGFMTEKCIYGLSNTAHSPISEKIAERGLQLSVFAGAGVQYNINRHIALYAEPLATYFFDNHSQVINIYKDRPLNIDIRLGLRYTLQ